MPALDMEVDFFSALKRLGCTAANVLLLVCAFLPSSVALPSPSNLIRPQGNTDSRISAFIVNGLLTHNNRALAREVCKTYVGVARRPLSTLFLSNPRERRASWTDLGAGGCFCMTADAGPASNDANAQLLDWMKSRGAWISPKIDLVDENERGFFANDQIEETETLITIPSSKIAISASNIRNDESDGGIGAIIRTWEAGDAACRFSDDQVLAFFLAARRLKTGEHEFDAYVQALPPDTPNLPVFWTDELRSCLPLEAQERVEKMRQDVQSAFKRCEEALESYQKVAGTAAVEISKDDFEWGWAHVTSRALREGVMGGGDEKWIKIFLPMADLLNHEPGPLPQSTPAESIPRLLGSKAGHRGAAVKARVKGDDYVFAASRAIAQGEEVTWTYGALSNEDLLCLYGFVPDPPVHGDNRFGFSLPPQVFAASIEKLEKEVPCGEEVGERKRALLQKLGAAGTDDALLFDVTMGCQPMLLRNDGPPAPLSLIARVMCLSTTDELATLALSDPKSDSGKVSTKNEARALRWCAWLLDQVYSQTYGGMDNGQQPAADAGADGSSVERKWAAQVGSDEREVLKMSWLLAQAEARRVDAQAPAGAGQRPSKGKKGGKKGKSKGVGPSKGFG